MFHYLVVTVVQSCVFHVMCSSHYREVSSAHEKPDTGRDFFQGGYVPRALQAVSIHQFQFDK